MPDPRDYNQQADQGTSDDAQRDQQFGDLEVRPEDVDQVKGGRARAGDPCDGGEVTKKLS